MKITKIELQKRNNKRASIFIDDEFAFGLSLETICDFGLSKNSDITKDFINDVLKKEEQHNANSYALNLLGFSARSKQEIITKMRQKEYEEDIINNTIEYLTLYNFLNDEEFSHMFIKDKLKLNRYGINRIRMELFKKGIDKDIIESVLCEYSDSDREYNTAKELAQKKLKCCLKDPKDAQYRKLTGFLMRKGFSSDIVFKIVKEII